MITSEVPHCVCVALGKEKQEHPFGVVSPRLNYPLLFLCLLWGCSVWFLGCPWALHCVSLSKPAWWLMACLWTLCCVAVYACLVANCLSCRGPKRSLCSIFIVQYRRHHREKEWGFFFFSETTSTILQGIKSLTPTDPGALRTANIPLPSTIYLSNIAFNTYGRFLLYKVAFISYHNTYTFALLSESGAWKSI